MVFAIVGALVGAEHLLIMFLDELKTAASTMNGRPDLCGFGGLVGDRVHDGYNEVQGVR